MKETFKRAFEAGRRRSATIACACTWGWLITAMQFASVSEGTPILGQRRIIVVLATIVLFFVFVYPAFEALARERGEKFIFSDDP